MRKVVVVPDSFKGTMTSREICELMKEAVQKHHPEAEVIAIPVADGGEGSVDSFLTAVGGTKVWSQVKGPFFEEKEIEAFYGRLDADTAVIEMAACSGLPLVDGRANPLLTTTYGVGQLMAHAINQGVKRLIVGLGGSCTNDGGTGAAAALGVKFFNEDGVSFIPTGGTLKDIVGIDKSLCTERLKGIEIITMCDIDNPLYGEKGAAYVFAPQKGADKVMVEALDQGLRNLAKVIERVDGKDLAHEKGAGAAGGMGFGMVAFLDATLQMGIETVLDIARFDTLLEGCDVVFTGEGKIDQQSLRGKVVMGVAKRAKAKGVPTIVVVGAIGEDIESIYEMGVQAIFTINKAPIPFEEAKHKSHENMRFTMDNVIRLLK